MFGKPPKGYVAYPESSIPPDVRESLLEWAQDSIGIIDHQIRISGKLLRFRMVCGRVYYYRRSNCIMVKTSVDQYSRSTFRAAVTRIFIRQFLPLGLDSIGLPHLASTHSSGIKRECNYFLTDLGQSLLNELTGQLQEKVMSNSTVELEPCNDIHSEIHSAVQHVNPTKSTCKGAKSTPPLRLFLYIPPDPCKLLLIQEKVFIRVIRWPSSETTQTLESTVYWITC